MVKNDRSRRTFCPEDGRACYTPEGPEPEGFSCANYDLCKSFEGSPALKANPVTAEDVELLRDFFERHIETDEDHALYNRIALALLSSTPSDAATGENDVCDSRQEDAGSGGLQGGANAHTRPLECRGAGEGRNNRPALPASGAARRSDPASEQLDNSDCQLASTPSDTGDELREALTKAIDFLQTAPLESGVCCCGSPVEGHGFGDGHSPVDELRYHASNLAEGLAAALSKAPQATRSEGEIEGWQPIETAPKDGTDILVVHRENRSFLQIVAWEDGETVFKWCSPDGPDYHENAFSHWMPLPEPPARTAGD
jgi:hypothetical protein